MSLLLQAQMSAIIRHMYHNSHRSSSSENGTWMFKQKEETWNKFKCSLPF